MSYKRKVSGLLSKVLLGGAVAISSLGLSGCGALIELERNRQRSIRGEITPQEMQNRNQQIENQMLGGFVGGLGGAISAEGLRQGNPKAYVAGQVYQEIGRASANSNDSNGATIASGSEVEQNVYVGESQNQPTQAERYIRSNQKVIANIPKEEIRYLGGQVNQLYCKSSKPGVTVMAHKTENILTIVRICNDYEDINNNNNLVDDGDCTGLKDTFSKNEKISIIINTNKKLSNLEYRLFNKNGETVDSYNSDIETSSLGRMYANGLDVGGYTAILNKGNEFIGKVKFEVINQ